MSTSVWYRTVLPSGIGLLVAGIALVAIFSDLARAAEADTRPNVVLIMTDNHGAWTLGCYGNEDIRTPNIDRLAREGTLFTRAFASNPVCSPTRATFLTGLLPSQHGVHCFLSGGRLQVGPDARCTLDEFTSLPEVLRSAGYSCGLVGKWHLGANLQPQEGLDDYWITMPHGGTSTFYDAQVIENGKIRKEAKYLTDLWTDHAVRFIKQKAGGDQPFFLFLAYNGPYSLSRLLLREGRNRHAEYYADKELPSFPRQPPHPWQFNNRDYQNNPVSIRRVATEVSGIDDGVGTVMETLKKLGLDENTVVVFVADQGWVGGHGGFFGMGDHTRPVTARDGMMRIPMIWRHPGQVRAGAKSRRMVSNYDFMPTLLSHVGLAEKMPREPKSPGHDFSVELARKGQPTVETEDEDQAVFYEFESLRCIRTERWKYIHRYPNGPHELYDLERDADEFVSLVQSDAHSKVREALQSRLEAFFNAHAEPKYDMWKGGGSQTRIFVGIEEELAQGPQSDPPPAPDGFQPPEIDVPAGFSVELVAGPPLVTHPTLACLDDRGRLFVCNNAGVNMSAAELEEALPNSIRLLEDTDGDGRFDRATTFADKMTYPMGGAWHDGALYVASPPNIWRLEDTDDDGVADKRDILVGQFGYTGNAASIHGCFLGPDGRLYWCDGYHGHEFKDEEGNTTSKRDGSYLFSCKPDGSDVRLHCGGGMDNPVEVDFTDEGEMLGTVNILYTRPRFDCLVHWLHGGVYPHRERVLGEVKTTGDFLGPVHRFGHVAVSGTARYRSGVMDHRWQDNFFTTFFNSGKVVRVALQREGSTFRAVQREFLSSTSTDFHPTDVLEDADGSLLVVDTGGWFYRGCPTSQLSKPEVLGAIYRVRRDGMTTQVDPWGKRIDWAGCTDAQLLRILGDTRFKVRERAVEESTRRGSAIVPALALTIARRDVRERRNAVWALTRMVGLHADGANDAESPDAGPRAAQPSMKSVRSAIRSALDDRSPSVRLAACRSVATYSDRNAIPQLIRIVSDGEPALRREAAKALGRIGDASVAPALLAALEKRIDREEEHALIYALIELEAHRAAMEGLRSKSPAVRRASLIALDQMDEAAPSVEDTVRMLDDEDTSCRRAALAIAERYATEAAWVAGVARQLDAWFDEQPDGEGRSEEIKAIVTSFAGSDPIAQIIGGGLSGTSELRPLLLSALARCSSLPLHPSWELPLADALQSEDPDDLATALDAVSAIKTDRFDVDLERIAAKRDLPVLTRVAAVEARQGRSGLLSDVAFSMLVDLISKGTSDSQRAAQLIGGSSLTREQLLGLAPLLREAGPTELRNLIRPYQRNATAEVARAFLDAAERSRAVLSVPANELSDVVKRYPAELRPRSNRLLAALQQHEQKKIAKVDHLLSLLATGEAARGRTVFFSEKSKCGTCHRVGKQGGNVGPDLSTIGMNRSPQDLLESIVFPSSTFVRDYEPYSVATADGRVLSGLIVRESRDAVVIQQQVGDPVTLSRDEIDAMSSSTVSIMPSGLENALTESELADVIAYLMSLKAPTTD